MSSIRPDAGPEPTVLSDSTGEAVSSPGPTATLAEASRLANGIEDPASRVEALAAVSKALHKAGDVSRAADAMSAALAAAEAIPEDAARASWLARIAEVQASTGDLLSARAAVAKALETVPETGDDDAQADAIASIAQAQAETGDAASALKTAERIATEFPRERTLSGIALRLSSAGMFRAALSASQAIASPDTRAYAMTSIAWAQGRCGDVLGAQLSIARALEAASVFIDVERVLLLVELCRVQVSIGSNSGAADSMAEALFVAESASEESDRVWAFAHIARNQASLGDPSQARHTVARAIAAAEGIAVDHDRANALCQIAEAQARIGDRTDALSSIAEAVEIVDRPGDDWDRDYILSQIAVAQATAGDNRAALATARCVKELPGPDALLSEICEVQCWEHNFREAIATAREISGARERSAAFAYVARYSAQDGNASLVGQAVVLALQAARAIADDFEHAKVLVDIAAVQLDAVAG